MKSLYMKSYDLKDAFRDIQNINYQKEVLKNGIYRYTFPHELGFNSKTIGIGTTTVTYCKSAFNNFVDSDDSFDKALNSGNHHPISGAFNIGKLSPDEDILVCIDNIIPFYDRVWSVTRSAGTLKEHFSDCQKNAFDRKMNLHMPPYLNESFDPMIGIVGTMPKLKSQGSGRGGDHGGNLDLPCLKIGSKIILPSYKCSSDVWFGDIHAKQGFGELAGVALECSGEITFRIFPIKLYKKTKCPIIINNFNEKTGFYIFFVGCRSTFSNAIKAAINNAIRYEKAWNSYGFIDSYKNVGLDGDLVVGQAIGKTVSVAIKLQCSDLGGIVKDVHKEAF